MTWILFSLLAALVWAVVNVVDKYIISQRIKHPVVFIPILGLVSLISSIIVLSFSRELIPIFAFF